MILDVSGDARADPAFPIARHTDSRPGVRIWGVISFEAVCMSGIEWEGIYHAMLMTFPNDWSKVGKKYHRRPPECFITLYYVVWQLASRLEELASLTQRGCRMLSATGERNRTGHLLLSPNWTF
ncbi:hypothetical protein TNCV_4228351 [Trichonephila clavipes]|nr:hypothetical protein TNCV_4228351 [Trichonephila clavipes]